MTTEAGKRLLDDLHFAAPELWALHIERRMAEAVAAERARMAERVDAALFDLEVGRAHPGVRAEYRRVVMTAIVNPEPTP